jgi:predicted O-methyltransferase YrrM
MGEPTVWPSHCRMPPGVLLDRLLERLADHPQFSRLREVLHENRTVQNGTRYEGDLCIGLAEFILDRVPEQGLIVESGCFVGVSTEVFALLRPRCEIISIDLAVQDRALDRLKRYENVRVIAADTHDVARSFDRTVDTLYVDSDHAKSHVVRELLGWLPHVRPGGTVAGHDYIRDWPEVIEAIYEVFWQPPHYVYGDGTWVYVMPGGSAEHGARRQVLAQPVGDGSGTAQLLAQVDRQGGELAATSRLLNQSAAEVETLRAMLAGRQAEIERLWEELVEKRGRLAYMLDSFSWKVTAPLRAVRTHLGQSRVGGGAAR